MLHTQPAGHSLTPTTPARSSRSTREHPATIAWGHARPEGMRIHMISRALLLHGTARQSSRRPRGRGRVHESGHLQHGDAVAPPVRLPVGGRGVFVGWGLQEQQERLAARPQVGQRRQAEHGGFRRHPSQSRHRGTPLHSAQSSASVGFELVEVLPTDRRRHPAACHSADTANGCPGCTSCRKHRTPRAARRAGQGGLLSACLSVLSRQAHA